MHDDMNSLPQNIDAESDEAYVESSRNGSPEHFRFLTQRYQRPLFAFLASRLGKASEAEEAAQETFVRAFLCLKKLRRPESFYAWLMGIAGRVLKEQFRETTNRQRDREAAETMAVNAVSQPDDSSLEEIISLLPENYRQVILLRYYEGLSCQEVAARLGIPLGTVTKTLSRAYALLREELKSRQSAEETLNQVKEHELH
jgi:RNA polymerase sigma-70 factor (ECF subfamily)